MKRWKLKNVTNVDKTLSDRLHLKFEEVILNFVCILGQKYRLDSIFEVSFIANKAEQGSVQ